MEPAPPIALPFFALTAMGLGIYVFFTALALETYALVPVAVVCFAAAVAPALKLLKTQR